MSDYYFILADGMASWTLGEVSDKDTSDSLMALSILSAGVNSLRRSSVRILSQLTLSLVSSI